MIADLPPENPFPENLRRSRKSLSLSLSFFLLLLAARVHQHPEYRRAESPSAVPSLLMPTWPTKPFTKLPLGGVGSTGTWGRLVCVCLWLCVAVCGCVQRVRCAGCVSRRACMCVCEGAGDGVSMRACLCMHGVCGKRGGGTGVFLVTSSPVNAILSNSRTPGGCPSPSVKTGKQLYNQ